MVKLNIKEFNSCNKRWPKEELALGVTSEIYLLESVLRVGAAMVTSELR